MNTPVYFVEATDYEQMILRDSNAESTRPPPELRLTAQHPLLHYPNG